MKTNQMIVLCCVLVAAVVSACGVDEGERVVGIHDYPAVDGDIDRHDGDQPVCSGLKVLAKKGTELTQYDIGDDVIGEFSSTGHWEEQGNVCSVVADHADDCVGMECAGGHPYPWGPKPAYKLRNGGCGCSWDGLGINVVDGDSDSVDTDRDDAVEQDDQVSHCSANSQCDDGNECTDDQCVSGSCRYEAHSCDDGNVCTTDSCTPGKGCVYVSNTASCDDGDACTTDDVCKNSQCTAGGRNSCDDGNICTNDACNSDPAKGELGCSHTSLTEVDCSDHNAGTRDFCDPIVGCVHLPGNTCRPFTVTVDTTSAPGVRWVFFWSIASDQPIKIVEVSSSGISNYQAPAGACAATVEDPSGKVVLGHCDLAEEVEVQFCTIPQGGQGCAHDGACAGQ